MQAQAAYSPPPIDQESVPQVIEASTDKDPAVRRYIADLLGEADIPPGKSIAALSALILDPVESVSQHAAASLAKLAPAPVPALISALDTATRGVTDNLLELYRTQHKARSESKPRDFTLNSAGKNTALGITPPTDPNEVVKQGVSSSGQTQTGTIIDMGREKAEDDEADRLPESIDIDRIHILNLSPDNPYLRAEIDIAFALRQCGEEAIEPLLKAVRAKRLSGRGLRLPLTSGAGFKNRFEVLVSAILRDIREPVLESLIRWSNDKVLSRFALETARDMDPVNCYDSYDLGNQPELRQFFREAFAKCKSDRQAYIRLAIEHCGDHRQKIRAASFEALERLGAPVPIELLFAGLRDPNQEVRRAAARTVPKTVSAFYMPGENVRRATGQPVPKTGSAAYTPSLEGLVKGLSDPHIEMRTATVAFLIAGKRSEAIPDIVAIQHKHFNNQSALEVSSLIGSLPTSDKLIINLLASFCQRIPTTKRWTHCLIPMVTAKQRRFLNKRYLSCSSIAIWSGKNSWR